jgi:hypothetical protein
MDAEDYLRSPEVVRGAVYLALGSLIRELCEQVRNPISESEAVNARLLECVAGIRKHYESILTPSEEETMLRCPAPNTVQDSARHGDPSDARPALPARPSPALEGIIAWGVVRQAIRHFLDEQTVGQTDAAAGSTGTGHRRAIGSLALALAVLLGTS